jgi:hypothetical protein
MSDMAHRHGVRRLLLAAAGLLAIEGHALAQAQSARAAAPYDMTGYWVSVITQNWRLRMVTPARGDYAGLPLTVEAKKIADAWDPAKDEAAGDQCKGYGAGTIMTRPERLHIAWQDENTLRMDIDAGTQTRIFRFGGGLPAGGKPTWQGDSTAAWAPRRGPGIAPSTAKARYMKVATTNMRPGYVRQNGVPYSANAALTEYYDLIQEQDGAVMLIVTTVLDDPLYMDNPLIMTGQFKKQADAAGWDPTPCSARW